MAKLVGLSRTLKMQWLNQVVDLATKDLSDSEIKEQLNDYLSYEIQSPINIRKTREILMNVWIYDNDYSERLRKRALYIIGQYPEYSVEINWCMLLAAYPVFADMCKLIGKMMEFQDQITLSQLKEKLFDEWGERSTLFHSIDKLMSTYKNMGVLVCNKPGKYSINRRKVSNSDVVAFLLYATMCIGDNCYCSFSELSASSYLFPFEYTVEREKIFHDEHFTANNFGGELTISLNDHA